MVARNTLVTVISGVSRISTATICGMTVNDISDRFEQELNIPAGATATVNGATVPGTYALKAGDELTFSVPLGQKG